MHGDFEEQRADAAYFGSQEREHGPPTLADNFCGRHRQTFALPRIAGHAGGGIVIKIYGGELVVVQDAGDNAANSRSRNMVASL